MHTPVAFLIFNRPDTTERAFAEIAKARPPKLLVVADGPRQHHPDDVAACRATRAIIERVDWDCEVVTNYSDENLGCKRRVSSGLSWVFDSVGEAIVLEDDCLPEQTFFRFCEELLDKYREDERVTMISGDNFQFGRKRTPYSYYFTRWIHVWGWASWRRVWSHYDVDIKTWPDVRDTNWLAEVLEDPASVDYWREIFDLVYASRIDTWDYQLAFASWMQNGLSVVPEINLISNIGFGQAATHTGASNTVNKLAELPRHSIAFPLQHPTAVGRNGVADRFTFENAIASEAARLGFYKRLRGKLATLTTKK